ncbi:hypothetical protein BD779DRAFT_1678696 [Infundibulicybe gibba]|nr:hypothetical protein BD779DRAFT_1678696 [Infundibulicybe gibba]
MNVSDVRDIRLHGYFSFFSIVGTGSILYYDHLITIDREIKYVWKRPKMLSAYLFLANRYFSFSANLVAALFRVANFNLPQWALSGQRTIVAQKPSGCNIGLMGDTSMRLAVAWEALFVYDSIIFALTLAKTWQAARKIRIHTRLPIIALLLRDGAIYFAVMALANLANILTFYFCGPFLRGGLSTFSNNISVTMMSRLMLNLHETATVGIFSAHISTLGPISRAEFFNESLAISELPSFQENVGGAGPLENSTR